MVDAKREEMAALLGMFDGRKVNRALTLAGWSLKAHIKKLVDIAFTAEKAAERMSGLKELRALLEQTIKEEGLSIASKFVPNRVTKSHYPNISPVQMPENMQQQKLATSELIDPPTTKQQVKDFIDKIGVKDGRKRSNKNRGDREGAVLQTGTLHIPPDSGKLGKRPAPLPGDQPPEAPSEEAPAQGDQTDGI